MICAIYARSASVMQNETKEENLKDQIVPISNWAKKNGFTIVAKYLDPGMSGFDSGRPGFIRMMADAALGKFHTLIVRDLSRLSRSSNVSRVIEELKLIGIRVIAIQDGIDSAVPGSNLHVGFKAMMNHEFLDQIAKNIHRSLLGKATKGHNAGGRSYGYRHVPHFSETKSDIYGQAERQYVTKEPDEEQAKWVRQIFDWAAEGRPYHWIACELNRLKVPAIRGGTWTTSTICGNTQNPHSGILNNPLYLGKYIWNRTETVRNSRKKQTKSRIRPESDWIVVDMPKLKLISDEVWQAVKARQAARKIKTKEKAIMNQ